MENAKQGRRARLEEPVPASPQCLAAAAHFGTGQGMVLVMLLQHAGHPTVHKVEGQKENLRVCFIFSQCFVSPYAHNSGIHSLKVKSSAKDIEWPYMTLPMPAGQLSRDPLCPPVPSTGLFNGHPLCRRAPAEGIGSCVSKPLLVEFSRPPPRLDAAPLARVPRLTARPPLPPEPRFYCCCHSLG